MERLIEGLLYRSRWLLAPIYLGLSLALVALGIMNRPGFVGGSLI